MRTFDLTPLLRTSVGFDRTFDLLETLSNADAGGYPPYNIERFDEDQYRVTLAVAGFSAEDLDIEVHGNSLKIAGKRGADDDAGQFLHQGIAGRSFERRFQIADHVKIVSADLKNGLLSISLKQEVPEQLRPRKISINEDGTNLKVVKDINAA
ncbi:MAG: Hsp20 family protein [Pseudomonadota bacterium]